MNTLEIDKRSSLFKLTWPIFIELVLQMLVGNVDQFMMSQYSENSVAAIGNVNTIMNFVTITFSIVTMAYRGTGGTVERIWSKQYELHCAGMVQQQ